MLLIQLLSERDMYGYQMIETLRERSNDVFHLKAGTLYPILHELERDGILEAYSDGGASSGRMKIYYHLTDQGKKVLRRKTNEWNSYMTAVNQVLSWEG